MELRHLRYFVAVAETQNVTKAASRLYVSQPALSRQIRDLEEELSVPLFERSAKSIHLTEAGRVFLDEARSILARVEEAVRKVQTSAPQPDLHIGYAPSPTVQILPRALRAFKDQHPNVRVHLHDLSSEQLLSGLHDQSLDLALMVQPIGAKKRGLRFTELASYPMVVALANGHPKARARKLTIEQFAVEPLVAFTREDYPEYHAELERIVAPTGGKLRIVDEHDSVMSLVAAVEAQRGVALVSTSIACLTGVRVKFIPLQPAPDPLTVSAVTRTDNSNPFVAAFVSAAERTEV